MTSNSGFADWQIESLINTLSTPGNRIVLSRQEADIASELVSTAKTLEDEIGDHVAIEYDRDNLRKRFEKLSVQLTTLGSLLDDVVDDLGDLRKDLSKLEELAEADW